MKNELFFFSYTFIGDIVNNNNYVVKKGDTLWGISNQFGVSVTELANINQVNAETLKIGQILKIPAKQGSNPDNMFYYTVKKGDTLYSIAKIYGTTVQAIKNINYLDTNQLYIGQVLRIPEIYTKPEDMIIPNYINYVVQKGDTLYGIAKKYQVSVDTLIQDNALSNNNLVIGQNLKIRTNNIVNVEECFGMEEPIMTYSVQKGDTLYGIARRFGVSVQELMKSNSLSSNTLKIGQVLVIPRN